MGSTARLNQQGVPEALRNAEADEKIGFGKLVSSAKKGAISTVDSVAHTTGKVVGGATKAVTSSVKKVTGGKDDTDEDRDQEILKLLLEHPFLDDGISAEGAYNYLLGRTFHQKRQGTLKQSSEFSLIG